MQNLNVINLSVAAFSILSIYTIYREIRCEMSVKNGRKSYTSIVIMAITLTILGINQNIDMAKIKLYLMAFIMITYVIVTEFAIFTIRRYRAYKRGL